MKTHLLFLFGLIISISMLADVPQGISHQAVIRDLENNLIVESPIGLKVSILHGSHDGDAVYVETHNVMTNKNGLISYVIGNGSVVQGVFQEIDWADGHYWLETKADPDGGTNYSISGVTMFLSVPYALHAKTAEGYSETDPLFTEWDKSEGITIIEEQIVDLQDYLTEETDPVFLESPAADIDESDLLNWNEAFNWGNHGEVGYLTEVYEGILPGEMKYWDGSQWLAVLPGQYNQTLRFCDGVPTWGECPPTVPVVTTSAVINITDISATSGGTVIEQGGANVTIRGLLWSTQPNPTLQNNEGFATSGAGTGSYTINMTGLTPQTQYYVRAFAGNAAGVGYASQLTFTTEAPTAYPPTVTTATVTEITQTSAISGGDVTDDGGAPITAKGVVWNTSSIPTVDNNAGMTNEGTGSGGFVSELTGLTPNTNYYLRAYAINSHGITYGSQKVFITLSDPSLPTLITSEITDITPNSAISGGEITDAGEGEILMRGVCYSTSENPTVDDFFTQDGDGMGSFISELTNLMSSTTYYVRAYASSTAGGIGYGNQLSFTTPDGPPSVEVVSINSGQPGFRKIDAVVTHDGGHDVTARGFVWHTSENPTLDYNEGFNTKGSGLGEFTSDINEMTPNTVYYVRAYASNSEGTGYSDQVSFNFWDYHGTVTDIDGNTYNTVMIGEQEWMVENLKTTKYRNGVAIEYPGNNNVSWSNNTNGAYAWYDNDISWKNIYGALYNWHAVNNENRLCPAGWRVSSDYDLTQLIDYMIAKGYQNEPNNANGSGNALKSCKQINSFLGGECDTAEHPRWDSHDIHQGLDEFGFSAFAGGFRNTSGGFGNLGHIGFWWSSCDYSSINDAVQWDISNNYGFVHRASYNKWRGFSVRCVKGEPSNATVSTSEVTEITKNSAISGGNITSSGYLPITARGVVWGTSPMPTIENNKGKTTDGIGHGSFTSTLSGLIPNTGYFVRAYATNSLGTSYGEQIAFSTLPDANLPSIITAEITNITSNSATSGGDITNQGTGEILLKGVCYSTNENPTVDDFFTQDGDGVGSFISELTNLMSSTTYYVRAYASSTAGGIGYGNQLSFTTPDGPPSLEITTVNNTQPGYTTIDAVVSHDGGQQVTERGFVWHIIGNPTLENNMGSIQVGSGTGEFTSDLTGLIPNTVQYVRAFATNSEGTTYSNQVSFNFWDYHGTVTDIDGNVYNTVMIGEQEWMAENLKTTKYRNGVPIEYPGEDNTAWSNNTSGAYSWYNNDISFKNIYGALYNWHAVNSEIGLCPAGWHVPTDDEWTQLIDYITSLSFLNENIVKGAGNALKSCRQQNSPLGGECATSEHPRWDSQPLHYGTNEFGFSALPGGNRSGSFHPIGYAGRWWSSTEGSDTSAYYRRIRYDQGNVRHLLHNNKTDGFSVRCVKD